MALSDGAYVGRGTSLVTVIGIDHPGTGPVFVVSAVVCGLGGAVGLCARGLRRAELPR
ncbi:hypothetical protein AB0C70_15325 [Streptomyces sp. NPDC048564]|uniref:hypothetical protein n=1 Tax=Streptomyces sp. NPDC048564 TaxID=3155760 RepID=UPI0034324FEE